MKSPHAADGGFSNPDSAGTLAVQHWFTQSASAPDAPGTVNFRTIIGADAPIADAKVVFTLPELPEGGQWKVDPVVLNNPALRADGVTLMQTWNYVRDYQNLPVTPEGKYDAEANTITYELGDMPANSGVTAMFRATGLTYSQIMEFTQPVDGFYSNNFEVSAELTGEFEKGYAVTCAPEGAYDDSFTTPGEEVTVNLNNEDTFAPGTKFSVKNSSEGWTVSVDENGRIVATPPADTANGVYDILIEAVSPIGAVYQIPARVHVSSPVNLEFDPSYDDSFTTPGQSVIVNLNGEAGVPAGSTFEVTDFPAGWTVNVTGQGRVTATPPADSKSVVETVTVTITTPSGDKVEVPARIHVQAEPTIEMEVGYRDADGNLHVGELPPGVDGIAGHVVTITESNGETSQYFVPNGVDGKTATVTEQGLTDEGDVWVLFSDGTRIVIPSGRDVGSSANERCLPAALTVAAPLLMLLPLGIISPVDLPITRELNSQMAAASAEVQKSLGIFNAQGAQSAARLNGELAKYGEIGGMVGGALIGIAVIGLLTKYMVDNCAPVAEGEEPGSFALPEGFGSSS